MSRPSGVSMAAPTRKRENGAWARRRACRAASMSLSMAGSLSMTGPSASSRQHLDDERRLVGRGVDDGADAVQQRQGPRQAVVVVIVQLDQGVAGADLLPRRGDDRPDRVVNPVLDPV